ISVEGRFVHLSVPLSICITRCTYHHILPANTPNYSIHWYLYDEQEQYYIAHNNRVSDTWISAIKSILHRVNPYENLPYTVVLELRENTSTSEIAAIMHTNNTIDMTVAMLMNITINRIFSTNNCLLNISLIGIIQNVPEEVKNTENAIIKPLVNDYTTQEHNFTVNIIYPYLNSQFKHFKNSVRPGESLLFVIVQLEIIQNKFYMNAKKISSKLLLTHQNILEELKKHSETPTPTNTLNLDILKSYQSNLSSINSQRSKHIKAETASINDKEEPQMDQKMTKITFEENDLVTENNE
ncbi:33772_t:CDS:2, partial [Gigaspora margarita]